MKKHKGAGSSTGRHERLNHVPPSPPTTIASPRPLARTRRPSLSASFPSLSMSDLTAEQAAALDQLVAITAPATDADRARDVRVLHETGFNVQVRPHLCFISEGSQMLAVSTAMEREAGRRRRQRWRLGREEAAERRRRAGIIALCSFSRSKLARREGGMALSCLVP